VDSKAEFDQLNLAHKTKTNKASAHLIQKSGRFKVRKGSREGIRIKNYGGKDL